MAEYTVEMEVTATATITVEADGLGAALAVAQAQGCELSDINEITDSVAKSAEFFQD